jgi:hypothetical protein
MSPNDREDGAAWWGIANLVLLFAGWAFAKYNLHLYDSDRSMLFRSWAEVNLAPLAEIMTPPKCSRMQDLQLASCRRPNSEEI